jgi:hypothetical protein
MWCLISEDLVLSSVVFVLCCVLFFVLATLGVVG